VIRSTIQVLAVLGLLAPSFDAQTRIYDEPEWKQNSSDESCSIFSNDDGLFIYLWIGADGKFGFRVHAERWDWAAEKTALVTISGEGGRFSADGRTALTSDKMSGLVFVAPEATIDLFPDSGPVDVSLSGAIEADITLPALDSAIASLRACAIGLSRVSEDEYAVRTPRPKSLGPFTQADFAGMRRPQAALTFRLHVDKHGKATRCEILDPSGSPAFDARACELLLERSDFEPGANANGEPVPATFQTRIAF
tara:strand:- start:279 stop:1034 length:756 start_codon:yes stop_codon:yes gene_type:complete